MLLPTQLSSQKSEKLHFLKKTTLLLIMCLCGYAVSAVPAEDRDRGSSGGTRRAVSVANKLHF